MDLYPGETPVKRWVRGSCHCGKIQYEANIKSTSDTDTIKLIRCNCTSCQKLGSGNIVLDADGSDFKLLHPASTAELASYKVKNLARWFCPTCSVFVWCDGFFYMPDGQRRDHMYLNVASIDQPQEGVDISRIKAIYLDGITFGNPERELNIKPSDTPYPGGLP